MIIATLAVHAAAIEGEKPVVNVTCIHQGDAQKDWVATSMLYRQVIDELERQLKQGPVECPHKQDIK